MAKKDARKSTFGSTIVSGSEGIGDELCSSSENDDIAAIRKIGTRHFMSQVPMIQRRKIAVSLHWYRTKEEVRFLSFQKALCTGLE